MVSKNPFSDLPPTKFIGLVSRKHVMSTRAVSKKDGAKLSFEENNILLHISTAKKRIFIGGSTFHVLALYFAVLPIARHMVDPNPVTLTVVREPSRRTALLPPSAQPTGGGQSSASLRQSTSQPGRAAKTGRGARTHAEKIANANARGKHPFPCFHLFPFTR